MSSEDASREGYLVVADIAGYTAFLTGTELEHGQAIIDELISLVRGRLTPPLRFVKLEGDAVLCYAEGSSFTDGERLTELLEVCYFDFSSRLFDMAQATTCPCVACASMGTLDLKFVAHYGSFLVRQVDRAQDVAGPDVILVHRLLKNTVTEQIGCRAYVLFTEACLEHLPPSFARILPEHREAYESFGEVRGAVQDLKPVAEEMRATRREYIDADAADIDVFWEVPVPPAVIWSYFVDPSKRQRWDFGITAIISQPNDRGRLGVGASSHCAHKGGITGVLRRYVDWRPFSYFTATANLITHPFRVPRVTMIETTELTPLEGGGTLVQYRSRIRDRSRFARFVMWLSVPFLRRGFDRSGLTLLRVLEEDGVVTQAR